MSYRARVKAQQKAYAAYKQEQKGKPKPRKPSFADYQFGLMRTNSSDVRHNHLVNADAREDARERYTERRLILSNGPEFPQEEWFARVKEWGEKCLRCGDTYDLTIDHIIPVSLGGTHAIENLQLLCRSCNSSKGTKKDDYRPPKN